MKPAAPCEAAGVRYAFQSILAMTADAASREAVRAGVDRRRAGGAGTAGPAVRAGAARRGAGRAGTRRASAGCAGAVRAMAPAIAGRARAGRASARGARSGRAGTVLPATLTRGAV